MKKKDEIYFRAKKKFKERNDKPLSSELEACSLAVDGMTFSLLPGKILSIRKLYAS